MLWTCFKVISLNCEKGSTICFCDSWSLLDFCHFFLILFFWLWNHVQSQQQENKVRSGCSLYGGVVGGSGGAISFGWFLGGFVWCLLVAGDFKWFQMVRFFSTVVTRISQHTDKLFLYCTHGRTWFTDVIRFCYSK